jgi:hypothetical protein
LVYNPGLSLLGEAERRLEKFIKRRLTLQVRGVKAKANEDEGITCWAKQKEDLRSKRGLSRS